MSDLITRSQTLNAKLIQVTNQDTIAVTIQSWGPLEDNLEEHIEGLRELVDAIQTFQDEGVLEDDIEILGGINIDPLLRNLDQLKQKFAEDPDHVMQGQLSNLTGNKLNSCKDKLEARLREVWKAYADSARSSIKGLGAFLELQEEMPDLELVELERVSDNLDLLQQRSRRLPLGNSSGGISEISAFCSAIGGVIEGFGGEYQKRAKVILTTINDLNDKLIIEDENLKQRVESLLSQAKTKFESFEDVDSLGDLVRDVIMLEPTLQDVWSVCVQSLHGDIQYIETLLKSQEEKDLMGSIYSEQNELLKWTVRRCDKEGINEVNKLSESIKKQIKVLVDKAGLSDMPDNVSEFIKKLHHEGATLEDLQGGVFGWLEEQGMLKHFKLK